jgi:hypothetical protein
LNYWRLFVLSQDAIVSADDAADFVDESTNKRVCSTLQMGELIAQLCGCGLKARSVAMPSLKSNAQLLASALHCLAQQGDVFGGLLSENVFDRVPMKASQTP